MSTRPRRPTKADRPLGLLMRITYADGHFFHVRGDPKEIAAAK